MRELATFFRLQSERAEAYSAWHAALAEYLAEPELKSPEFELAVKQATAEFQRVSSGVRLVAAVLDQSTAVNSPAPLPTPLPTPSAPPSEERSAAAATLLRIQALEKEKLLGNAKIVQVRARFRIELKTPFADELVTSERAYRAREQELIEQINDELDELRELSEAADGEDGDATTASSELPELFALTARPPPLSMPRAKHEDDVDAFDEKDESGAGDDGVRAVIGAAAAAARTCGGSAEAATLAARLAEAATSLVAARTHVSDAAARADALVSGGRNKVDDEDEDEDGAPPTV